MFIKICFVCLLTVSCGTATPKLNQFHSSPTIVAEPFVNRSSWNFGTHEGVKFQTPFWNIHTTIQIDSIVDSLPSFYSDLLDHYTTIFGEFPYPRKQIEVFLFAEELQWKEKLKRMLGNQAKEWYSLGRGGLTVDGVGVLYHLDSRSRSRVTLRIAAHEGWHQYAESVFINCLPTWLDEGIGTWMEGFRIRNGKVLFTPSSNWDRLTTMRKIISANQIDSLEYLLESDPSAILSTGRTNLLGYYAQLWAFTSFIVEFEQGKYMPGLHRILTSALHGTLREPRGGWLYAFTSDPREMEREYNGWVLQYTKPGSSWR